MTAAGADHISRLTKLTHPCTALSSIADGVECDDVPRTCACSRGAMVRSSNLNSSNCFCTVGRIITMRANISLLLSTL